MIAERENERIQFGIGLWEAALTPGRREVEVVCIRPGLSRNGNYYGQECLHAALPLFEGARAYADHSESNPRSVRDLVGYYRRPRIGADGEVRCTLKVTRHADWLWSLITESIEDGSELVGLSVDVRARTRQGHHEGTPCRLVEQITRLHSVDVITRASAGGRFEKLAEADKQSWWDQYEPPNERAAELAAATAAAGGPVAQRQRPVEAGVVNPVQLGPSLAERIDGGEIQLGGAYVSIRTPGMDGATIAAGEPPSTSAPLAPPPQVIADSQLREGQDGTARLIEDLQAERARFSQEMAAERARLESERLLDQALRESDLPRAITARVAKRLRGTVFSAEELRENLDEERALLAELSQAGMIRGLGYEKSTRVTMTEAERLQKAFDQLFDIQEGERVPQLSGIREAYVAATRDLEVSGVTPMERLREADVTTASFAFLLGTSMNKRLLKDYQAWPSEWQKFCTITPIKDFKQQDRIRLGAFGSLSTVSEDTAYTQLTLSDARASYAPAKRGNLVSITRETIVNDDLYAIKQIPGKLAVAAAFTLAEFIYQTLLIANGAAIYDTFKLFDTTNHLNTGIATASLGTANSGGALAVAALQTAITKMRRQTNLAAKPIGLKPRYLLVPPELEWQAMVLTKSAGSPGNNNNDINPMLGYVEVIVAPQIASPTYWVAVADPRVIDTIEVGFVGGQMNPQLFIQDQPLFGANFTNDVVTYKVRHEWGAAVVDYRGFYLGNN